MKTVSFEPELTPEEREKKLKKIATVTEFETFNRTLTESEVDLERHAYAETGMRLDDLKFEAKESAEQFKLKIKNLEGNAEEHLKRVRTGQREVYDVVFGVPDYNTGLMVFFDKYGEIVRSRALVPDEYNGRFFDTENEPIVEETKSIDWDGVIEDAQTSEIEDATVIDDDDLPEFLKPDENYSGEKFEPEEDEKPRKKPRKNKNKDNSKNDGETV